MDLKTFTVGDSTYGVGLLTGRKALSLSYRLAKYIGPSLAPLAGAQMGAGFKASDFESAVSAFFANCPENEFLDFANEMFKTLQIDNKNGEQVWQTHFMGKPAEMYKVLMETVKVHFADFLSEFPDLAGTIRNTETATKKAPTLED